MHILNAVLVVVSISFVMGCASTIPVTEYCPEAQQNVFPFFFEGQPIAAIKTESAFMLLALEPTQLGSTIYLRLWVLYQNTSDQPYLLEPLKFADLTTTRISWSKSESSVAESPTKVLKHISDEKAALMIAQAIGGVLQATAVKPTTTTTHGYMSSESGVSLFSGTTVADDQQKKRDAVSAQTAKVITNTAIWYDLYLHSVSQGILRRNTVFPGQGVNGYVYFPFPRKVSRHHRLFHGYEDFLQLARSMDYLHVIAITMPTGVMSIKFIPIEGE